MSATLLWNIWCARIILARFSTTRQVVTVLVAAKARPLKSTSVSESAAREHALFTDIDEEIDKRNKEKTALRNSLAEFGAQHRL